MKGVLYILFLSFCLSLAGAGDYIITADGKKIEPARLRLKGKNFHLKMKDRTQHVYTADQVKGYYLKEDNQYFERLDLKEKKVYLEVLFTDGRRKIVAHENMVNYAGAVVSFTDYYYYDGEEMQSTFNKKNQMKILNQFDGCTKLRQYIRSKKRWYGKLDKLQEFAKTFCNVEMI